MQLKRVWMVMAAALVLALAACSNSGGSSSGSSGSSGGSSSSSSSGGSSSRTFSGAAPPSNLSVPAGSQGFVRTVDQRMVLYVIPQPAPPSPTPLMIVLDYLGGNPTSMANLIFAGAHAAKGAVMAFPAHQGAGWNDGKSTAGDPQIDIAFLTDVIADANTKLPVDASKISMTGYSSGGFMAELFACTKPGLLSGVGMVAAAQLNTTHCETGTPLRVASFNGTQDMVVPYGGSAQEQSVPATLAQWENTDACSGQETTTTLPTLVNDGTTVVRHQIPGCAAMLYEIVNGGHTWPGAMVTAQSTTLGTTSQNIDAAQAQWDYFSGP